MNKYGLLRWENNVVRVLEVRQGEALIIDCVKQTMPIWVKTEILEKYSECTDITGFIDTDIDTLDAEQRKVMYERFTVIAGILPFVADEKMRSRLIRTAAKEHNISCQTVRSWLCLYLAYMDITALAPKNKNCDRALTQDERNMRWALNKFFYNKNKNSLMTAYTMLLKEKYCDTMGLLNVEYPSFYQFRYFYRKTRNLQNFYISRNGLKNYQRNNRPLVGGGTSDFAPNIGVGMLDTTVCDIYLINNAGNLVARMSILLPLNISGCTEKI